MCGYWKNLEARELKCFLIVYVHKFASQVLFNFSSLSLSTQLYGSWPCGVFGSGKKEKAQCCLKTYLWISCCHSSSSIRLNKLIVFIVCSFLLFRDINWIFVLSSESLFHFLYNTVELKMQLWTFFFSYKITNCSSHRIISRE